MYCALSEATNTFDTTTTTQHPQPHIQYSITSSTVIFLTYVRM